MEYENGTAPDQMMRTISRNGNAVNNFTIRISQAVVNQSDFGVYHLKARNLFGEIAMIVNVIPQSEYEQIYNHYNLSNVNKKPLKFNVYNKLYCTYHSYRKTEHARKYQNCL